MLRQRQVGAHKFRRQHRIGPYIVDFICLERRLVVEVDGAQHADRVGYDAARDTYLLRAGFRVLRFSDREALTEHAAVGEAIFRALSESPPPQPSPSVQTGDMSDGCSGTYRTLVGWSRGAARRSTSAIWTVANTTA
ncbi:MAG: endonuclease domain-containing protein [Dehalococcoidia bacterium]|nr:endonuclease domain-containing protein [Dehalococcoidia bacterium]